MRYLISITIAGALLLSASQASADPKKEAREHFSEGLSLYKSEDFAGAARELGLSYNLKNDQTTLFAWAQALRLNGDCEESKTRLKQYIANGANAKQSKAAFDLMDKCAPAVEPVVPDPVEDPNGGTGDPIVAGPTSPGGATGGDLQGGTQATPAKHWYRDWLGITLMAAGGVSLTLSAFSYASAKTSESDAKKPGVTLGEFKTFKSDAEESRTVAVVFGVAGGMALTGAAVYILTDRFKGSSEESAASGGMAFVLDGQGGSVSFAGSF
jgi:hypothetical protein